MPQNPLAYLRGMLGRRQPTLGCIAPETVTAPHGTVDHVRQIAEAVADAKQAALTVAPDVNRARPGWVRPDPVEGGPTCGYGGGGDDEDEAMTEPVPLEPSHKPEPWPPIPPRSQTGLHTSERAEPLAPWSRGSLNGMPVYPKRSRP